MKIHKSSSNEKIISNNFKLNTQKNSLMPGSTDSSKNYLEKTYQRYLK